VLTKIARENGKLFAIAFEYGQRHEVELMAAQRVASHFGIPFTILGAPMQQGDSVLMNHDADMPHLTYEEIETSEGVSPTYVPFRNGTFLALAAGFALQNECSEIWMGVHAEDARGWAYPDCTPEFVGAMANAIYVGTYHKVRLCAPLQYMMKKDVVRMGLDLGAPYHLTHSCYEGIPACGKCPTCVSRLEAFRANGAQDPIMYEFDKYRVQEWGGSIPPKEVRDGKTTT
jgi:7-cyano-7-deazaguanine synthase